VPPVLSCESTLQREAGFLEAIGSRPRIEVVSSNQYGGADVEGAAIRGVDGERLVVGPVDAANEPDLSVRSTLGALLAQLPMFRRDDAPPVGRLHVSGDAELARRLQRLAERFDPDWQQPFAAVFGDVLGMQIANTVASALKQARRAGREFAETTAEYLTEESRDVVGRDELNAFHDDVDALRDDVERLAARVARMRRGVAG